MENNKENTSTRNTENKHKNDIYLMVGKKNSRQVNF